MEGELRLRFAPTGCGRERSADDYELCFIFDDLNLPRAPAPEPWVVKRRNYRARKEAEDARSTPPPPPSPKKSRMPTPPPVRERPLFGWSRAVAEMDNYIPFSSTPVSRPAEWLELVRPSSLSDVVKPITFLPDREVEDNQQTAAIARTTTEVPSTVFNAQRIPSEEMLEEILNLCSADMLWATADSVPLEETVAPDEEMYDDTPAPLPGTPDREPSPSLPVLTRAEKRRLKRTATENYFQRIIDQIDEEFYFPDFKKAKEPTVPSQRGGGRASPGPAPESPLIDYPMNPFPDLLDMSPDTLCAADSPPALEYVALEQEGMGVGDDPDLDDVRAHLAALHAQGMPPPLELMIERGRMAAAYSKRLKASSKEFEIRLRKEALLCSGGTNEVLDYAIQGLYDEFRGTHRPDDFIGMEFHFPGMPEE